MTKPRFLGPTQMALMAGLFGMFASAELVAQSKAACKCGTCTVCVAATSLDDMEMHRTGMFAGAKANTGYAVHSTVDGKQMLKLSDDFVVPDTPAPHWQIVDSEGNVYLLNRLKIKEDRYNQMITLPGYIKDVVKVQIWCAWAETLLGEASFEAPVQ